MICKIKITFIKFCKTCAKLCAYWRRWDNWSFDQFRSKFYCLDSVLQLVIFNDDFNAWWNGKQKWTHNSCDIRSSITQKHTLVILQQKFCVRNQCITIHHRVVNDYSLINSKTSCDSIGLANRLIRASVAKSNASNRQSSPLSGVANDRFSIIHNPNAFQCLLVAISWQAIVGSHYRKLSSPIWWICVVCHVATAFIGIHGSNIALKTVMGRFFNHNGL